MTRSYTTAQIAERLHCSTGHIRRQIDKGLLNAAAHVGMRHRIHHSDLIRWLISINWPAPQIRQMFPLPGPLAAVGIRGPLLGSVLLESPRYFHGLLDLGIAMAEVLPWGIVVDLPNIGATATILEFSRLSRKVERPILIAIIGDDGNDKDGVFDIHIPGSLPPGKIAQRIRAVRPWRN